MKLLLALSTLIMCAVCFVQPANGDVFLCDYLGYDYTHPIPRDFTSPGQLYEAVGEVPEITPDAVETDYVNNWYTFHLISGTLTSADTVGGVFAFYHYDGVDEDAGTFHIYEDPILGGTAPDFGTFPPNATAPSSFNDHTLLLGATFTSLQVMVNLTNWTASLNGTLQFYCGEEWGNLPCYEGWTFAGMGVAQPGIPDGYLWQIDGEIYVEEIATENSSWGDVKQMFR